VFVFFLVGFVNSQNIKFTGTVYDSNGAVVPGAKINATHEKGPKFTGSSNNEGEFVIPVVPGIYALDVSAPGFLSIKYDEYFVVNSTNGKMKMDFVLFGSKYHEPCGYSGADCLPTKLRIKSVKVEYSPKLKEIRDDFSPETRPEQ